MTSCADLRILFRAPAGARHGFGHLARCRSLAGAFGVRTLISLRGGAAGEETALALGCDVVRGGPITLLESIAPDVLVVDDPDTADAARWRAAGRRAGCLVISVHDLGLGCLDADLVIDGSVTLNAHASRGLTSAGPESGLLDPSLLDEKASRKPFSVLVTIGGGPPLDLAIEIAEAIVDADPRVTVRSRAKPGRGDGARQRARLRVSAPDRCGVRGPSRRQRIGTQGGVARGHGRGMCLAADRHRHASSLVHRRRTCD
jgi:spore coat polysaccharide biosynthesis predicted glycosyltransferase SpsG